MPLQKAVQLQPENAEARINLGYAYGRLKRYREAISEMREALRLKPDDVDGQFFLGTLYLLVKDRQAALVQLEAVRSLNPQLGEKLYEAIYRGKIVTAKAVKW